MNRIFLLLVLATLTGCHAEKTQVVTEGDRQFLYVLDDPNVYVYNVIEIDGCEYIAVGRGRSFALTHKGNCRHCQERHGN